MMKLENVEDIYPLSPMQQGMLFHSLSAPQSGMYVEQLLCSISGDLNIPAFQQAWQRVIDRHPILRTAFLYQGLDEPLQVVRQHVELPWELQDWCALAPAERDARLKAFSQAESTQGFDFNRPPLMHLVLAKMGEQAYRFIWSFHHILIDGWSMSQVFKEVLAFYGAFQQGRELQLAEPPAYRDYIAWLKGQDLAQAKSFWTKTLAGFNEPTDLSICRAAGGPTDSQIAHQEQRTRAPAAVIEMLQSIAHRHQLTLNTILQGAWALLLSHYSGSEDIVFGVTVSGRPPHLDGVESMVGLFINTLPLRVRVPPQEALLPWLKQIQDQQVAAGQYEYSPLAEVQTWSEIPRGQALFESILVFENYPLSNPQDKYSASRGAKGQQNSSDEFTNEIEVGGLRLEISHTHSKTNYPLGLMAVPSHELWLHAFFDPRRLEADAVKQMLTHWETLLENVAAHPESTLAELPFMTEGERNQLLWGWNNTRTDYSLDRCVHHLFEAQARLRPRATALIFEGKQLTYQELDQQANQVARYLRQQGVVPDVLVGICMERSLEMIVATLGVLKAGGAFVPLDPTYPKERLAYMLEDSQVSVLLTQERLTEALPEHSAKRVCLDRDWELIAQQSITDQASPVGPENLAYVIYTSGSTGKPKGVCIPHRSIVNRVLWTKELLEFTEADCAVQKTPFVFDVSVGELFLPLAAGGRLVIARPGGQWDSAYLVQLICKEKITFIHFVPSMLRVFLQEPGLESCMTLKHIWSGGETLSAELAKQVSERLHVRLYNGYGPTEATVGVTCHICHPTQQPSLVPIGRPIANARLYLVDHQGQLVPIGVPGELCVGGIPVGRGYLHRPDLTSEKFVPDPYGLEPGARLYKSGDLARYRPDGEIEFLGRMDHQVKMRGFRIELGEIETALRQHTAVREAVVLVRETAPDDQRLVAYLLADPENKPTSSELRQFLESKLPEYMVPGAFIPVDQLPMMPNGKIDRQALLTASTHPLSDDSEAFAPPRTDVEQKLAAIWQEVLDLETVSVTSNFFDLGGHSLLMAKVQSRIQDHLGLDISVVELFQYPTIRALAAHMSQGQEEPAAMQLVVEHVAAQKGAVDQHRQYMKAASERGKAK